MQHSRSRSSPRYHAFDPEFDPCQKRDTFCDLEFVALLYRVCRTARSIKRDRSETRRPRFMGILDNPFIVLAVALVAQWGAACAGDLLRKAGRGLEPGAREDFDIVRNAALTLLALIIGF